MKRAATRVCGGDQFATCAAVNISVVGSNVTVRLWNLSGNAAGTWGHGAGTHAGTVFNGIGFYNTTGASAVLGSLSVNGPAMAGTTPGSFRVIATQQGGTLADTSTVTVTAPPTLVRVVLSPTTAQVQPGGTQQFSAAGRMSDSSNSTIAVTYDATGGTITAGGLYTAGTTTVYTVVVSNAGPSNVTGATVTDAR